MKLDQLECLILHRRPYRETSYIVDFFTREEGKVSAVCKGVRGSKSERKSLLQPFQPLLVSFRGRHELKNTGAIEPAGRQFHLSGMVMFSAMYLNEILSRSLPLEMAMPSVYETYIESLKALEQGTDVQHLLRHFEITLLDELGFGLDWQHDCVSGEPVDADGIYTFVEQQGFRQSVDSALPIQRIPGDVLLGIAERQWNAATLKWAKLIMRQALLPILGTKPLKSRELFLQLEQTK